MDYELMMNGNVKIGQKAPDFEVATTQGVLKLDDYKGKWLVLFSYPGDFMPICMTEIIAFTYGYTYFQKMNTEILGLSIDSNSVHEALQMLPTTKNEAITCKHLFNWTKKCHKTNQKSIQTGQKNKAYLKLKHI